uniref:Uncharacterized protein n=1 Tax=Sphaerodactylus townsendi TaxID=933632 RepID=A0ACB8ELL8_9SAUR
MAVEFKLVGLGQLVLVLCGNNWEIHVSAPKNVSLRGRFFSKECFHLLVRLGINDERAFQGQTKVLTGMGLERSGATLTKEGVIEQ